MPPHALVLNGCRLDGIGEQIVAFCEGGTSFTTTHRTQAGIVAETHPLSLGVLGIFGDSRADSTSSTPCDLLIAVGVSFSGLVTRSLFARWRGLKADVVHVDRSIGSWPIRLSAQDHHVQARVRQYPERGQPRHALSGGRAAAGANWRCRGPPGRGIDSPQRLSARTGPRACTAHDMRRH